MEKSEEIHGKLIKECEEIYGKLLKEDDNFYYFEGRAEVGVTIPKHTFFKIISLRFCQNCLTQGCVGERCVLCGEIINI